MKATLKTGIEFVYNTDTCGCVGPYCDFCGSGATEVEIYHHGIVTICLDCYHNGE